MTLHQPWHDGVGRRVGKRLRHIRRPKKPPDPGPSIKEWKHTKRKKKKPKESAVVTISLSIDGLFNLFSRRAVGRRIGGRRWPSCATKHRLSRELFRARYYHKHGRFSRRSSNRENTPNKKRASSFMTALPTPIFPNLPTISKVKHKRPPIYGLSSTAIAIVLTITLIFWFIQRFTHIFSPRKQVAKISQSIEGKFNLFSRRAVGRRIGRRRWPSCATKHRQSRELHRVRYTQAQRTISSWRQSLNILRKTTTFLLALSSLGLFTFHPGNQFNTINYHHPSFPEQSNSFSNPLLPASAIDDYIKIYTGDDDDMANTPGNAESKVLHSGGTALFS